MLWSDIDRAVAGADWPTIVTRLPGPDGKIFRGSLHDWMSAEGKLPDVFTVLPPGDTATLLSVPSTHESWMETGRWTPVTMNQTDSGEQTAGSDGEFSPRQLFVNFAEEPSSDLRDFLVEHRLAKPAPRSSVGVVLTTGPAPDAGGLK